MVAGKLEALRSRATRAVAAVTGTASTPDDWNKEHHDE
jgi:hypothetical protein